MEVALAWCLFLIIILQMSRHRLLKQLDSLEESLRHSQEDPNQHHKKII